MSEYGEIGVYGIFALLMFREAITGVGKLQDLKARKRLSSRPPQMGAGAAVCGVSAEIEECLRGIERSIDAHARTEVQLVELLKRNEKDHDKLTDQLKNIEVHVRSRRSTRPST